MLTSLKATIEKKKRERDGLSSGSAPPGGTTARNIAPGKVAGSSTAKCVEESNEEEAKRIRALQAKAKRYKQLEEGETSVIPVGAHVDFEKKVNRPLVLEEELIQSRREEESQKRSIGAAIPPPASLYGPGDARLSRNVINAAVESILSELHESSMSESSERARQQ